MKSLDAMLLGALAAATIIIILNSARPEPANCPTAVQSAPAPALATQRPPQPIPNPEFRPSALATQLN